MQLGGTATPSTHVREAVGRRCSRVAGAVSRSPVLGAVRLLDALAALAAFAALATSPLYDHGGGDVTPVDVLLALVTALPLAVRQQYPLPVLAWVSALLLCCLAVFGPAHAAVAVVMLAVYTAGRQGGRQRSLVIGLLMAPVVTAGVIVATRAAPAFETVTYVSLVLLALVLGDAVRTRQVLVRTARADAERERRAFAQHLLDLERLRLAHELHDVIGHELVAINVQASAAAHLAARGDRADPDALRAIAHSSQRALSELRSTLKVLRSSKDGPAPLEPLQELGDLASLVRGIEATGLEVELTTDELPGDLPAAVGHAAYRIVQESLTNVLRHSSASRVAIAVAVDAPELIVTVTDPGPARPSAHGEGHGLPGMVERCLALGGSCTAGPPPEGGWRVTARLPLASVGQHR